jgi:Secretion system C-terminal sorting domain
MKMINKLLLLILINIPFSLIAKDKSAAVAPTFSAKADNVTLPSLPFNDPSYMPNGSFNIVASDLGCAGTYSVSAQPVLGSGPSGSTPPIISPSAYIGFGQGGFLFGNAGYGTYEVTVTETNVNCSGDPKQVKFLVVIPNEPPKITGTPININSPSCAFNSANYVANGSFTINVMDDPLFTGIYVVNAVPIAASGPNGSTPALTPVTTYVGFSEGNFLFNNAGAGQYKVTITNTETIPYALAANPIELTVTVPNQMQSSVVGGTLSPAQTTICGGTVVSLTLTGHTGSTFTWEQRINCKGAWTTIPVNSTSLFVIPSKTSCYRVKVSNGCTETYSSIATITVDPPAVGGAVVLATNNNTTTTTLCPTQVKNLKLINAVGTVLSWQTSRSLSGPWVDLPFSANQPQISVNGQSINTTTYYRCIVGSLLGFCTQPNDKAISAVMTVKKQAKCTNPNNNVEDDNTLATNILKAYPNPAMDKVTLQIQAATEGVARFDVLDITGKIIKSENRALTGGYNEVTLDIQNLASGLHLIKIKDSANNEAVVKMSKM